MMREATREMRPFRIQNVVDHEYRARVLTLIDRMPSRHKHVVTQCLSTIGHPIYQSSSLSVYERERDVSNATLMRLFHDLYDGVRVALAAHFDAPCKYSSALSLPGFHQIRSNADTPYWGGTWHRDVFALEGLPVSNPTWTFTVLVGDDNGPYSTELKADGLISENADDAEDVVQIEHSPGALSLFPSASVHRIGPMPTNALRTTLQGHASPSDGGFVLFW